MAGLLSTQGTREVHWEPDSSLIDAAREIAPIIREYSEEAERERRLSQPVLTALREAGKKAEAKSSTSQKTTPSPTARVTSAAGKGRS